MSRCKQLGAATRVCDRASTRARGRTQGYSYHKENHVPEALMRPRSTSGDTSLATKVSITRTNREKRPKGRVRWKGKVSRAGRRVRMTRAEGKADPQSETPGRRDLDTGKANIACRWPTQNDTSHVLCTSMMSRALAYRGRGGKEVTSGEYGRD